MQNNRQEKCIMFIACFLNQGNLEYLAVNKNYRYSIYQKAAFIYDKSVEIY